MSAPTPGAPSRAPITSRPERDDPRTVEVSRTGLILGVAALGACLLVIAFLLGRQSAPHRETARSTQPPAGPDGPSMLGFPVPGATIARDTVARYFAEVEAIEARAKTWNDPTALAQTVLQQAVAGDASGFDSLIAAQRTAHRELKLVSPPEPCRPHLDRTVELLDEATTLLEGVRNQIVGGDLEGLAAVAVRAQALESKVREVDALAAGIKKRFGL